MVVTKAVELPNPDDLTVQEVNISTPALKACAFQLGKRCENQSNEFMLCRQEYGTDPRPCVDQGKELTGCAVQFFKEVKDKCLYEFMQYAQCLDQSSGMFYYNKCRTTQGVYDGCIADKLEVTRPEYGYFCRAKVLDTERPAPAPKPQKAYKETPGFPKDYPIPPARYGSRYIWIE